MDRCQRPRNKEEEEEEDEEEDEEEEQEQEQEEEEEPVVFGRMWAAPDTPFGRGAGARCRAGRVPPLPKSKICMTLLQPFPLRDHLLSRPWTPVTRGGLGSGCHAE